MKYINKVLDKEEKLNEEEYKNYLYSELADLEYEYRKKLFSSFKIYDKFSRYLNKNIINKVKKKINFIQEEIDKKYGTDGIEYAEYGYFLNKYDYKYNTNFYGTMCDIKRENDINKKKNLLIEFQKLYNEFVENIIKNKLENEKVIKKMNSFNNFIKLKLLISKREVEKIKKENREKNKITNSNSKKRILDDENKNYITLTNDIISTYELNSVLESFRNLIRTKKITTDLVVYLTNIIKRLMDEKLDEENFELIYSIIDSIKYRKQLLNDDEIEERKILNICSSSLKKYIELYLLINTKEKEKHDYKFDIIVELLRDKDNYYVVKNMVKNYPQVVNVRNNNKNVVIYILMLYLNNYNMILDEHKYNYNIDYLKEVYRVFCNSTSMNLSSDDKIEINNIINKFIEEIKEKDLTSKRKKRVINDVLELSPEKVIKENKYLKNVDKFMFDANMGDIKFYDFNHSNRSIEKDLTFEHTFMLNDPYTCYSYVEEKGIKSLKIHTADFSNLVDEGSALENYIYNCQIKNKKVKEDILSYLRFKEGDIVSAFTYEIILDNNRKPKKFRVYRSRIKVDGDILDYHNNKYVYQNLRRIVTDFIRENGDNKLSGLAKIEYVLNKILQKQYVKTMNNNDLPMISLKKEIKKGLNLDSYSYMQKIFNKLPKSDYKRLGKIFESDFEEKYYDGLIRGKDECNLFLTGTPNYIYLLNQRKLKELLNNELFSQGKFYKIQKEKTIEKYNDLKNTLNDVLSYKSDIDFDYKKRRNFKTYSLKLEERE